MPGLPADPRGRELLKMLGRDAYDRWVSDQLEKSVMRAFRDVVGILTRDFADLTPSQRTRQLLLYGKIQRTLRQHYTEIGKEQKKQAVEYARFEGDVAKAELKIMTAGARAPLSFNLLTVSQARAIAELPIAGLDLGTWWDKQVDDMTLQTRSQIQLGLINGEHPYAIARRIVGPAGTPGVSRQAVNRAVLLARTTNTTVQNAASFESYKGAGKRVTNRFRYLAVRDTRTTTICISLDGQEFEYDDPKAKLPPQHINCRSTIIPIVNAKALGIPNPYTGPMKLSTYGDWLRTQDAETQAEVLGKKAATLFRNKDAELSQLIRDDGRRKTLAELRSEFGIT